MTVAVALGICILSGIMALAILSSSRLQQSARSAKSEPAIAPTSSDQAASFGPQGNVSAPVPTSIQYAPIISAERFARIPDQAEMYLPNIPMPVARPNRQVIGLTRKSAKIDQPNGNNKNEIAMRDVPIYQTEAAKRQPNTIGHESKTSEFEARKTAATELEKSYSNAGVAISTHVSGINGTELNLQYPQFNDALVQKLMSVHSFAVTLSKVGFKKIIFTANQNKTWAFPLQPPSQSDTALQEPASTNK